MKFCTFSFDGENRVGVSIGNNEIADVTSGHRAMVHAEGENTSNLKAGKNLPPVMTEIIELGDNALKTVRKVLDYVNSKQLRNGVRGERIVYSLEEVKIRPPLLRPGKILAIAINNKEGFEKAIKPPGELHPVYFIKLNTCLIGAYDAIEIPDIGIVGPELEVAAVIGKKGKNIPEENAREYIFGYTVHNDITAFELRNKYEWITVVRAGGEQQRFTYAGRYKCFDTFGPMGPWLVTADEFGNFENHKIVCRINGEVCQNGSTSDLYFKFPCLISYLSVAHTLEPGDIISGGTVQSAPGMNIQKIDLRRTGGTLEGEVEGIGILKNPIKPV